MAAQDAQPFRWRYPDLDDDNFQLHGRGFLLLLALLLALLLFFALLCLYVRWACCRRRRQATPPLGAPQPGGLDARLIGSLPVLLHKVEAPGESTCSICLGALADGDKVKMLPGCRHTFHPECVDQWLRTQSSCPLCRACIGELQLPEKGSVEGIV